MTNIVGDHFTIPGLVASGNLSAVQYKHVKYASTAGAVVVVTASTDTTWAGILLNDPTTGQPAEVAPLGLVPVITETGIAQGVRVGFNSTGQAASGHAITVGRMHETTANAGNIGMVLLDGAR